VPGGTTCPPSLGPPSFGYSHRDGPAEAIGTMSRMPNARTVECRIQIAERDRPEVDIVETSKRVTLRQVGTVSGPASDRAVTKITKYEDNPSFATKEAKGTVAPAQSCSYRSENPEKNNREFLRAGIQARRRKRKPALRGARVAKFISAKLTQSVSRVVDLSVRRGEAGDRNPEG